MYSSRNQTRMIGSAGVGHLLLGSSARTSYTSVVLPGTRTTCPGVCKLCSSHIEMVEIIQNKVPNPFCLKPFLFIN